MHSGDVFSKNPVTGCLLQAADMMIAAMQTAFISTLLRTLK
jgi:hypothetical protein